MTAPAVIAFAERLGNDEVLRKRMDALAPEGKKPRLVDIALLAAGAGYVFSVDELEAGLQTLPPTQRP
jgi:hypothetical protein